MSIKGKYLYQMSVLSMIYLTFVVMILCPLFVEIFKALCKKKEKRNISDSDDEF